MIMILYCMRKNNADAERGANEERTRRERGANEVYRVTRSTVQYQAQHYEQEERGGVLLVAVRAASISSIKI